MAKAMDVADYIIWKANELDKPVSNLQLQKIMYFLNVSKMLESKGKEKLITDNNFERWDYGPVIDEVYREYSKNGSAEITKPSTHYFGERTEEGFIKLISHDFNVDEFPQEYKSFIDNNIGLFLNEDPFYLVRKSHEEPQWKSGLPNYIYRDDLSLEYYKENNFWSGNDA